jgi:hypothetical protein
MPICFQWISRIMIGKTAKYARKLPKVSTGVQMWTRLEKLSTAKGHQVGEPVYTQFAAAHPFPPTMFWIFQWQSLRKK